MFILFKTIYFDYLTLNSLLNDEKRRFAYLVLCTNNVFLFQRFFQDIHAELYTVLLFIKSTLSFHHFIIIITISSVVLF